MKNPALSECFLKYGKRHGGKPSVRYERIGGPSSSTGAPSPRVKTRSQANSAPEYLSRQSLDRLPYQGHHAQGRVKLQPRVLSWNRQIMMAKMLATLVKSINIAGSRI